MTQADDGTGTPLAHSRQATIDALMEHFAADALEVEEFERRVDLAHAASTRDELRALLVDLPGPSGLPVLREEGANSPAVRSGYTLASPESVRDTEYVVAALGGTSRRGQWRPARKNYAVAVMGGTELDFREAILPPGVTEVQVWTVCGGVEIVVPPDVNVESRGIALLGGFDDVAAASGTPDPTAPTIRITGVALMAGVDISVRRPEETARDARRRLRQERRDRRRQLRDGS